MDTNTEYLQKLQSELRFFESKKKANGSPFFPFVIADRKRRIEQLLEEMKK